VKLPRTDWDAVVIGALELVAYDPSIQFMSSFARIASRT